MPDMEWIHNLSMIIKKSMQAEGMCDVIMGTVTGTSPLRIEIGSQMGPLSPKQLLLTQNVTDHPVEIELPGTGRVTAKIQNGLKQGEKVILIQVSGGQQFVVLDRW